MNKLSVSGIQAGCLKESYFNERILVMNIKENSATRLCAGNPRQLADIRDVRVDPSLTKAERYGAEADASRYPESGAVP